jgi:hypothetical protein
MGFVCSSCSVHIVSLFALLFGLWCAHVCPPSGICLSGCRGLPCPMCSESERGRLTCAHSAQSAAHVVALRRWLGIVMTHGEPSRCVEYTMSVGGRNESLACAARGVVFGTAVVSKERAKSSCQKNKKSMELREKSGKPGVRGCPLWRGALSSVREGARRVSVGVSASLGTRAGSGVAIQGSAEGTLGVSTDRSAVGGTGSTTDTTSHGSTIGRMGSCTNASTLSNAGLLCPMRSEKVKMAKKHWLSLQEPYSALCMNKSI